MLEHENSLTIPDFTLAFPRAQGGEDYIILEALISRTDVPCSQHSGHDDGDSFSNVLIRLMVSLNSLVFVSPLAASRLFLWESRW
jgi:hypothetical protein